MFATQSHAGSKGGSDGAPLSIRGIAKRYPGQAQPVLAGIDLDVAPGESIALLGPSGCGKTTLLKIIAGFIEPDDGHVLIRGRDMTRVDAHRRHVGMVHQNYALWPHMTVADNVAFGLEMRNVARQERVARVADILELVGLAGFEGRMPKQLSGGQQQRVALARALVTGPDLLLLDEPLSSLDANLRQQLQHHLRHLQRVLGVTTVMVTHDREEAMGVSSRIVAMNHGRIVQVAPAEQLYRSPLTSFVMQFTGDSNLIVGRCRMTEADGLVVETPLGPLVTRGVRPRSSGTVVRIGVRPEDIRVTPRGTNAAGPHHNLCQGTIEDVLFLGAVTTIDISIGSGALTARCPTADAPNVRVGDAVDVTVSDEAIHVFDEGEPNDAQ